MCIRCRVIAFLSPDTSRDLVTLTFALVTLNSCHSWRSHVTNHATKYEDTTPIRSWVTSYNVSHWLPLKMCTQPLRMRRITWPTSRGWKNDYIFGIPDPDLPIHYYNFGGSTMNIIKVICENNARPVLRNVWDSAHAPYKCCWKWP